MFVLLSILIVIAPANAAFLTASKHNTALTGPEVSI